MSSSCIFVRNGFFNWTILGFAVVTPSQNISNTTFQGPLPLNIR